MRTGPSDSENDQVGAEGFETVAFPGGKAGGAIQSGAHSGALDGDSTAKPSPTPPADPELAAVIAAWSGLPPALRAGIAAMVKAAGGR